MNSAKLACEPGFCQKRNIFGPSVYLSLGCCFIRESPILRHFRSEKAERLREFNQEVDLDHNGTLNNTEIINFLRFDHLSHVLSDAFDLLTGCDSNDDHEISLPEFEANFDKVAANRLDQSNHALPRSSIEGTSTLGVAQGGMWEKFSKGSLITSSGIFRTKKTSCSACCVVSA
jgi:hypothetical protein